MRSFLGNAIETLREPPLVLLRVSPDKRENSIFLELWTEPGTRIRVNREMMTGVSGSGPFEVEVDEEGEIELTITTDNKEKQLRIPVRGATNSLHHERNK